MWTPPQSYFYHVSGQPYHRGAFQNLPIQSHYQTGRLNFIVNICVCFELSFSSGEIVGSTRAYSPPISSHYISCAEFFRIGSSLLRTNLSHRLIHAQNLDSLIPRIMSTAQQWFNDNCPSPSLLEGDGITVFPLAIDVIFRFTMSMDFVNLLGTMSVEEESMQEINMVPASEEAIQSLNTIELEENTSNEQCCVCLEDFGEAEISTMPCHHKFHKNCIIKWLKTSHLCPLCRYLMPVANHT